MLCVGEWVRGLYAFLLVFVNRCVDVIVLLLLHGFFWVWIVILCFVIACYVVLGLEGVGTAHACLLLCCGIWCVHQHLKSHKVGWRCFMSI